MKKFLVIVTVAVFGLTMVLPSAQAQILQAGFKGGVNMSRINKDHIGTHPGFFIGPMVDVNAFGGFGLDGAVMYSQRGTSKWKQVGLEIPINLKYTFSFGSMFGIYVSAGPDLFLNFKDANSAKTNVTQVSVNLGAGFKLFKHFLLGADYQIPTNHTYTGEGKGDGYGNKKTKGWQASLAYLF